MSKETDELTKKRIKEDLERAKKLVRDVRPWPKRDSLYYEDDYEKEKRKLWNEWKPWMGSAF